MALENVIKVYLNGGETSEIIEKLKKINVCLEALFNKVQIVKADLNSKIYLSDVVKAGANSGFDEMGVYQTNFIGPRIKLNFTYYDESGVEKTGFMVI